jgi:tetratricopeptide (TPR) repeat protein
VDILERVIENLTSDEVRRFKILSNRFKADEEKKVLILFDAIRTGNFKEIEEDVIQQLYGKTDSRAKNNYYRLRNKLMSNLEKSLLFYHFNYKNTIESYSYIQLATLFKERGIYREAYHYLKKAEKVATAYDQFNILEVIHDEMVQLASRDVDVDIQDILQKRRENLRKIEIQRSSSEVLGVILQEIRKLNFTRGKQSESVIEMLEKTKRDLEEHQDIFQSASGKEAIYKAVSTILLKKGAYRELEKYIVTAQKEFEENKFFDRNNHSTRILMRVWRINSLAKLLELSQVKKELPLLWKELKMFSKQNFNEYVVYYFRSKILNETFLGNLDEAAKAVEKAAATRPITHNPINELYLLISQADLYFNQELFAKAFEALRKTLSHKKFNTLDEGVQFYLHIFELVNSYEAKNYGYTESRYKSFKKKFKRMLKDEYYAKAAKFVELLMRMNTAALEGKRVNLKSAYKNFVTDFPESEIGDTSAIMYEVYLRSKLEDKSYYEAFREEISRLEK